jgi:GntR family transcriptional regulator
MTPPDNRGFRLPPLTNAGGGPLYEQIVTALKREVAAGRLLPGDPLPSFRALAEDLLVSLITVKRAYEELEREGIIFCRQGVGTFVADDGDVRNQAAKRAGAIAALQAALAEARDAGLSETEVQRLVENYGPKGEGRTWKPKR